MKQILIIEDDVTLNETLAFNLTQNDYVTASTFTAEAALEKIQCTKFDLIIMDVNLPDGNGFSLCTSIKKTISYDVAIVFLTANDLEKDILRGYNLGADDYITKPFSYSILQKKIEVILNRMNSVQSEKKYVDSHLEINFDSLTAFVDSCPTDFTPLEYQLLELLIENRKHILTRQRILDALWDSRGNYVDESSLNSIICRIRNKIDTDEIHYIRTVYGTGYMWMEVD